LEEMEIWGGVMIELRWFEDECSQYYRNRKTLQFRQLERPPGIDNEIWSEWEDVPTIIQGPREKEGD